MGQNYDKRKRAERKRTADQYRVNWSHNKVIMTMLGTYERCGVYSVETHKKAENVKTYSTKNKN